MDVFSHCLLHCALHANAVITLLILSWCEPGRWRRSELRQTAAEAGLTWCRVQSQFARRRQRRRADDELTLQRLTAKRRRLRVVCRHPTVIYIIIIIIIIIISITTYRISQESNKIISQSGARFSKDLMTNLRKTYEKVW